MRGLVQSCLVIGEFANEGILKGLGDIARMVEWRNWNEGFMGIHCGFSVYGVEADGEG